MLYTIETIVFRTECSIHLRLADMSGEDGIPGSSDRSKVFRSGHRRE